jgi:hypothetical protein
MFTGSAELVGWMVLVVISHYPSPGGNLAWILVLRLAQYKSKPQDEEDKKETET